MTYNPDATFNNGKHQLANIYNRLYARLVPQSGKCDTVEGEMLRASSRIYHDYYNNGFGNNWSGAYNFLDKHFGLKSTERKLLKPYARGKVCRKMSFDANDQIAAALEAVSERVVRHVAAMEHNLTLNTEDMFDLQEKTAW